MKLDLEPIKEYAKQLYLTPNNKGNHKYSLQNIADMVLQKFNKRLTKVTISNWANRYGWKALWEEAVRKGVTTALGKEKDDKEKSLDEKYKELIMNQKRDDYLMATNLKRMGYKYLREHGFNDTTEALRSIEVGMKYTDESSVDVKVMVENNEAKRIEEDVKELEEAVDKILDRHDSKE